MKIRCNNVDIILYHSFLHRWLFMRARGERSEKKETFVFFHCFLVIVFFLTLFSLSDSFSGASLPCRKVSFSTRPTLITWNICDHTRGFSWSQYLSWVKGFQLFCRMWRQFWNLKPTLPRSLFTVSISSCSFLLFLVLCSSNRKCGCRMSACVHVSIRYFLKGTRKACFIIIAIIQFPLWLHKWTHTLCLFLQLLNIYGLWKESHLFY